MTSSRAAQVDGPASGAAPWTDVRACIMYCGMAPRLVSELASIRGLRVQVTDQVGPEARDADVLIGYHFPPGSLADLPRLRWLHLTGTGTDHLAATGLSPEVPVTTSAAVPVTAVAEYALSGLLLLLKDLPDLTRRRNAEWFRSDALLLSGSTVAVVGAGRIGRAVLTRLAALGAHPVAVTRDGAAAVPQARRTIGIASLAREAKDFDHLIACLPGGPRTRGLIGREVLAALPSHAVIVNVGRGETIDNIALHAALRSGHLRGAFIDVHEQEPLPDDDPAWDVPRLVVSPHRAFAFPDEPAEVARTFLANLDDFRRGIPFSDRWQPKEG